jgi:hypothetical protein
MVDACGQVQLGPRVVDGTELLAHLIHPERFDWNGPSDAFQRLASDALNVRTPVPGLLLAGQDVSGPGIQAACMSGLLAAAAIEPTLLRRLGG